MFRKLLAIHIRKGTAVPFLTDASGHPKHFHKIIISALYVFSDFFLQSARVYDGGIPKYGEAMFSENFLNSRCLNKWHKLKTNKFKSQQNNCIRSRPHFLVLILQAVGQGICQCHSVNIVVFLTLYKNY